MSAEYRSGMVALIGRPNVGKSTLLNRLVGHKVSITSQRPQTTRQRILGIHSTDSAQIVYVDTPGMHTEEKKQLNRYMNRAAAGSVLGVDCIVLVISAKGWQDEDEAVLRVLKQQAQPVILVINKIDYLKEKAQLLPLIEHSQQHIPFAFAEIIPLSALSGDNVAQLESTLLRYLPQQPPLFPEDQVSDRSERFLAAELVREQVFRSIGQEVPYSVAVGIEQFKHEGKLLRIQAVIWVEKEGQKAIIIGNQGQRLKSIGSRARKEMEALYGNKVFLGLWVKVRENWTDSARALHSLGFNDEV